jgi:hypothetical protein
MFAYAVSNITSLFSYLTPKENAFFVFKLYVPGSKLVVQYGSRTKVVEDQALSQFEHG